MNKKIKYSQDQIDMVFEKLVSEWPELQEHYRKELEASDERLDYIDIAPVSRYIVEKKKAMETDNFDGFFSNVEEIIEHGDHYVKDLIVIGLFEGIQNIGGSEIEYYRSFDKWLGSNSLIAWRDLIDSWEGTEWRKTAESVKLFESNNRKKSA